MASEQTQKKGTLFILSAPAGTGKTTLAGLLTQEFASVMQSISCTTRKKREQESDGKDYHFISSEEFDLLKKEGKFLECARVFEHQYGTLTSQVAQTLEAGKHLLLVIDTQGARQIRQKEMEAVFIFIAPPSLEELKTRLTDRKTESLSEVQERLSVAKKEMATQNIYDYLIINDDLKIAYDALRSIVIAQEHKLK